MKIEPLNPGFSTRNEIITHGSITTGFRGFRMTFKNGYTVSVQFGTMNYCTAYMETPHGPDWDKRVCSNAEVAIISPSGEFVKFKDGQEVKGHTTPEELAAIMAWTATLDSKTKVSDTINPIEAP